MTKTLRSNSPCVVMSDDEFLESAPFSRTRKGQILLSLQHYLSHYCISCKNTVPIYYFLPNAYIRNSIEGFKLQYKLKYHTNKPNTLILTSENSLAGEMCLFKVKGAPATDSTEPYFSSCNGNTSPCYAPCGNVELSIRESSAVVTLLIQKSYHDIHSDQDGFIETYYGRLWFVFGFIVKLLVVPMETPQNDIVTVENRLIVFDPTSLSLETCRIDVYSAYTNKPHRKPTLYCKVSNSRQACSESCREIKEIFPDQSVWPLIVDFTDTSPSHSYSFGHKSYLPSSKLF